MIQIHGKTILSMEFESINQSPWFNLLANYLKAQFSLTVSKSSVLTSNIKKTSSCWQYEKAQLILILFTEKPNIVNAWEIPYDYLCPNHNCFENV